MNLRASTILAAGLLVAADAPRGDAAKAELEKFQGMWQLVSAQRDGREVSKDGVGRTTLIIKGDTFRFPEDAEVGTGPNGTFAIDPTATPRAIDATPASGPGALGRDSVVRRASPAPEPAAKPRLSEPGRGPRRGSSLA